MAFNDDVPLGNRKAKRPLGIDVMPATIADHPASRDFELEQKFTDMAANDMLINGRYLNQPYKVLHNGQIHKAKVRVKKVVESLVLSVEDPHAHAMPRANVLCNIDLKCDRTIEIT